jgi:hypothetical protein
MQSTGIGSRRSSSSPLDWRGAASVLVSIDVTSTTRLSRSIMYGVIKSMAAAAATIEVKFEETNLVAMAICRVESSEIILISTLIPLADSIRRRRSKAITVRVWNVAIGTSSTFATARENAACFATVNDSTVSSVRTIATLVVKISEAA